MLIIFKILFKKLKEKKNRENSEKHWVETLKGIGQNSAQNKMAFKTMSYI